MSKINDLMAEIKEKSKKRDETLAALVRSLALKELWGSDPIEWPIKTRIQGGMQKGYFFYIKDSAGVEKIFNLNQIPAPVREAKGIADALKQLSFRDEKELRQKRKEKLKQIQMQKYMRR